VFDPRRPWGMGALVGVVTLCPLTKEEKKKTSGKNICELALPSSLIHKHI
jgi:hypothetical protein